MSARKPPPPSPVPEDFDPQPTVFPGGIAKMLSCFEKLRELNTEGYRSGTVLAKVDGWGVRVDKATTCSPFTATVFGMLFDPRETLGDPPYKPEYRITADRKAPLPSTFYMLHQVASVNAKLEARIRKARNIRGIMGADALVAFNLGYRIDPRDMRRGDFVGIDWAGGGGHATLCWDVHLDKEGNVDAFQFVSSNGSLKPAPGHGVGVTVGTSHKYIDKFLTVGKGTYSKGPHDPLFEDHVDYVEFAGWHCLPGRTAKNIDQGTFRKTPKSIAPGSALGALAVTRLWGMPPPTTDPDHKRYRPEFKQAAEVARYPMPKPFAMGENPMKQPEAHTEKIKPEKVTGADQKKDHAAVEKKPHKPVEQKPDAPTHNQILVEVQLKTLYSAGWIDKDPGNPDDINDPQSKDAIKAFQKKYGQARRLRVDGIAGPRTRPVLSEMFALCVTGQPDPEATPPEERKPRIERAYWEYNRADPAGRAHIKFEGERLELVRKVAVTLRDALTGTEEVVHFEGHHVRGDGPTAFHLPPSFGLFASIAAKVEATAKDGSTQKVDVKGQLEVSPIPDPDIVHPRYRAPDKLLAWDEERWPERMRKVLADLRTTPRPQSPDLKPWMLTQFGVKTRIHEGDTPVLDRSGKVLCKVALESLKHADIEGTMFFGGRIYNIAGSSGWSYDAVTHKPVKGSFDPGKSRWADVTDKHPFGSGARMALIPFRVLAVNPYEHAGLFHKKVYLKQLDGLLLPTGEFHNGVCIVGDVGRMKHEHFDFFCGNEDAHLSIPSVGRRDGRILVELQILEAAPAAVPRA